MKPVDLSERQCQVFDRLTVPAAGERPLGSELQPADRALGLAAADVVGRKCGGDLVGSFAVGMLEPPADLAM